MSLPSGYSSTTLPPQMMHYSAHSHQRTAPRPILKRVSTSSGSSFSSSPSPSPSMKVHFPPHASLTQSFAAHSPSVYDRTPIRVAPNLCELPEHGCPGRTYDLDEDALSDSEFTPDEWEGDAEVQESTPGRGWTKKVAAHAKLKVKGFNHAASRSSRPLPPIRALSFDKSSSSASDESDGFGFSPFLNGSFADTTMSYSPPSSKVLQSPSTPTQLVFLPYPHAHALSGTRNPSSQISMPLATYPASPPSTHRSLPGPNSPIHRTRACPVRTGRLSCPSEMSTNAQAKDEGCLGGF